MKSKETAKELLRVTITILIVFIISLCSIHNSAVIREEKVNSTFLLISTQKNLIESLEELKEKCDTRDVAIENKLLDSYELLNKCKVDYNKQVNNYKKYVRKLPINQFLKLSGYKIIEFDYLNYCE